VSDNLQQAKKRYILGYCIRLYVLLYSYDLCVLVVCGVWLNLSLLCCAGARGQAT